MRKFVGDLAKMLKGNAIFHTKHLKRSQRNDVFKRVKPAIGKTTVLLNETWLEKIRSRPIAKSALGQANHLANLLLRIRGNDIVDI